MRATGATNPSSPDRVTSLLNRLRPATSEVKQKATNIGTQVLKTGSQYVETVKKGFDGAFHLIAAVVLGIGSALGATFAKDSTAFDWLSKVGIVISVTFGGMGIYKLMRREKDTNVIVQYQPVYVSDTLSIKSKRAYSEVKKFDMAYEEPHAKSASRIASYDEDENDAHILRDKACELYKNYKEGLEYLRPNQKIFSKETWPLLPIGNIADNPKSIADVQYENTILASYVIATRQGSYENDELCKNFSGVLEPDGISETNADLFTDHFNVVYASARLYDECHIGDNNSIKDIFEPIPGGVGKLEDIPEKIKEGPSLNKTALIQYLQNIQDTRNNLMVLNKAITYVSANQGTSDPEAKKEFNQLRAALVAGFRLQGDEDKIFTSISGILRGDPDQTPKLQGLTQKIELFEEQYKKIDAEVLSKVSSELKKVPKPHDKVFTGDLGLCELEPSKI